MAHSGAFYLNYMQKGPVRVTENEPVQWSQTPSDCFILPSRLCYNGDSRAIRECAMTTKAFNKRVWAIVAKLPPGQVISYGQLAILAGRPGAPRLAGRAMREAPEGLPCHRVVRSDGSLSPADMFHGLQRQMLEQEGVCFLKSGRVDMARSGVDKL
jgi:methylated-DNA-protein-cysteine methyltransferase-like protein